ncbi:MAG TPA: alpha/beta hydrolase family protein [Abditibacteriaceae bacterium]|jgi:dienelactone hydrolase
MISFNTPAYLQNLHNAASLRFDYRGVENGDWETWRAEFCAALESALGLPLIRAGAQDLALAPRIEDTRDFETYTREKICITTEPGIEIPFYLLLPKNARGPLPLVLCPHGHGRRGKETYAGDYEDENEKQQGEDGERNLAIQAVQQGYAAIAPDVRGFWEMARREDQESGANNSCAELQKQALMFGRTLIGERVHDMGRLLDYAATRREIDISKVVITGNSGGGTVSLFTAALDERISIAAPSCYFCTFFDSIISIHHCPCNIVPGVMNLGEMWDVAGLIAPRPMLAIAGRDDSIFPIQATQRAFGHLQNIYAAQGTPNNCELFVGEGGHRYYKARVWDFVREHFAAKI